MIYGIGDLHLDYSKKKPMDIFGENWLDHEEKIFENWKSKIKSEDLVLMPGDISWALKLEDAYNDLKKIDELPGKKIITKGNHDYWWESKKKMNSLGLETIFFLQNDSYKYENITVVGTRGWKAKDSEDFTEHDEKMYNREVNRLKLSLDSIENRGDKIISMLHYPPFNLDSSPNEFVNLMREYDVDICIYGHLHSEGHKYVVEDIIENIEFLCVSSDYIDFNPFKIY
ncbi:metallophosphoesterase [Anaerosalibacter massiliensis]|uniref:Metallophosphoesterase n=1 Tax=Anaerosalibacter massiliensis TaxID=1347392 RepID=A0A9X2S8K2_9FIRM|nr:metallophosphoesterase [Anaerosalibacter massiliensis]MCR2045211.1 metallophosphoesterase [Anaerosalibacter massiliensis]